MPVYSAGLVVALLNLAAEGVCLHLRRGGTSGMWPESKGGGNPKTFGNE